MKNYLIRTFAICLALGCISAFAIAQNDTISAAAGDRYVISAKAGGVNYVEGTVAVVRRSGRSGVLLKGDTLEIGDRVSTAENGKAEILLNPGSFLRLGGTSAFEFNNTSLDELEIRLDSGSAILEVYAASEFKVNVKTPSAMYSLIKSGIFRIDVPGAGDSTLRVWKGLAAVGPDSQVKAGRTATASSANSVAITKFDRDTKDSLDEWSKSRSKGLAQQTSSLRQRDLRVPLMRGFLGRRWNFFNSFGLWVYDPFNSGYSFLPFNTGWSSPYGYIYGNGMTWWFDRGYPIYLSPTSGGSSTAPDSPSNGLTRSMPGLHRRVLNAPTAEDGSAAIPPFVRMEQTNGIGTRGVRGIRDRGDDSSNSGASYLPPYPSSSSAPSMAPPSYGPPTISGGAAHSVEGKAPATLRRP